MSEQKNKNISVFYETGQIKNTGALVFPHIQYLHLVHSDVALLLASSELKLNPK